MHVVATAGHVDHGKSTLVRAVTGTDPDRLAEEKARGLTIDLGFAGTTLPSGRQMAFVDVPGHVRFLKNMLAGVGTVDACLFVVATTEGWMAQSEEHLRILDLLGVGAGVVALTKVATVDDDRRLLARLQVEERVAGTFLDGAPIVEVDAPAGIGLDVLRDGLDRLLSATPTAADRGRPRLWVDRSFPIAGSGTVVTGTLTGGSLAVGDDLSLTRADKAVRVRGLQTLGRPHDRVRPGSRVAVNLAGVPHSAIRRGDALVRPEQWHATTTVDASLLVLPVGHRVSRRGAFLAYLGTGEHPVRLRVLGPDTIGPGARGLVRLHLPTALPLLPGDRFVLRESGRAETVGGGEILDVAPVVPAARARPDRSIDRVVAERGWIEADDLERLTGVRRSPQVGRWVVAPAALAAARAEVSALVEAAGPLGVETATLDERRRALAETMEDVVVEGGRATVAGCADPLATHPFVVALASDPFRPPAPTDEDRTVLRRLVERGLVVEHDGTYFSPEALAEAARRAARLLVRHPGGFTVAHARDEFGTSRKWAVPLLAHLDAAGVTRRRGDVRVAGPRLPAPVDR